MNISISDIAKEAGVSKMTVSRVINNHSYVSDKTREKVNRIIRKWGYNTNIFAQNLAKRTGFNIVGIVTGIDNIFGKHYFMELINNIETCLEKQGYSTFIFNLLVEKNLELQINQMQTLIDYYHSNVLRGLLILGPPQNDNRIKYLSKNGVRGIILGEKIKDNNFGYISINNKNGIKKLVKNLINNGHREIAFIKGPDNILSAKEREEAFYNIMEKYNLEIKKEYIKSGGFIYSGGRNATKELIHLKKLPTAIIASNDDMAVGVYDELKSNGLKIPDDMSVCGFDNISLSQEIEPQLTTVAQPFHEIGRLAADCVLSRKFGIKKTLAVKLIQRGSVGKIEI